MSFLDLPAILSEDYCGFLDPREKVWKGESGKGYYLKNLVHGCLQALEPFDGIFGFSKRVPQYIGQTLFRFPLRNRASALSSEIYTVQKLEKLLELLKEEAQYLLIFLRSVCAIEVYHITEKNETLPIFSVSVSRKDYQMRSSKQKQLLAQVKSTFSSSYPHEIIMDSSRFTLEVVVNGSIANKHELLVVNQVGSEDNEVMRLAEKQHVLPWVGTAVELAPSDSSGRIFCVLPLPIEDRTPFCVHVNGTFAVSSNRRSLKWEAQERKGDEESTWNKLLIGECIPACYFKLITELMELPNIDPSTVYCCWPVLQKVSNTPWNGLLEPFYELLLYNDKAVHCVLGDSQWISIEDSVIIPDNEAVSPIIKQVVLNCGVNLVELESNQHRALNEYYDERIHHLTPSKVRNTLKKKSSAYNQLSTHDKMVILQYCLADNCVYANLIGLELLPLANGAFKTFEKINRSPSQASYVYICSPAAPVSLLPDVLHKLINVHKGYPVIHRKLCEISTDDYSMVKQLTTCDVSELLLECKTTKWSSKQMKLFWNWLQDKDLSNFHSREIVPTKHHATNSVNIVALTKGNGVVYVSQNMPLSSKLMIGLEKCGIKFAHVYEFSYLSHSQIDQYLYCFEPNQVLDAITLISAGNIKFSNDEAIAIQRLFSESDFNDNRLATISRLPLFKVLQIDESVRTSINAAKTSYSDNKAIVMKGNYDFKTDLLPNDPLIFERFSNDAKLLRKLESIVCFVSETDYLQKVAFVQIRNGRFRSSHVVPLMLSVLDNFYSPTYKQVAHQLTSAMKTLPFVKVSSAKTFEAPCNLFDPENEMLKDLFLDKTKFPSSNFQFYLPILRQCGLRSSVNSSEILQIIQLNQATVVINHIKGNIDHVKYCKVVAALKYLVKHPNLLSDNVHVGQIKHESLLYTLQKQASQYCWLPVASNPPNSYPSCLAWKGSQYPSSLASASAHPLVVLSNDLASLKFPLIIGSQAVFIENVPTELANHLCSSSKYLTQAVATHFKLVTEKCEEMSAEKLKTISMQTYNYLLQNIDNCDAQMLGDKWMWLENISSFVAPTQVAVAANPSFRVNLEPYVFVLPPNLQKFSQLFTKCGVSPTITTSQILLVLESLKDTPAGSQRTATEAWSIVTSILTWLAEDTERINEGNLLVPVESSLFYPQLLPIEEVSYTDNEMLRDIANASEEEYNLIHPKVSHLAPILGLTPLSDKLDITEDIFEDTGQHEPLITRLSNILREYKDGLTIIKEMIQNADDAGATEVNILYDSRTHSTDNLLFKGMAESHGPALIVHNNSTFTEEDFENITKLAGATKANQPLKIGKFGVGFCSVYHITDVPSFVSGEWLYIFDPTLKYLKGVVRNESRPGKKLKYQSKFIAQSQQLVPYQGLFGFGASSNYNGTMFRLPFRNSASQISSTIYNNHLIQEIKKDLQTNASQLLLFLQNVKCITFNKIRKNKPVSEMTVECNFERDRTLKCITCPTTTEYWLVSCQEQKLTTEQKGNLKHGTASVACYLKKDKASTFICQAIEGKAFCFLPLSVPSTGLPVHVSANFAVMSNRSGIWAGESSEVASDSREQWNKKLMTTIIPKAYITILKSLKTMYISEELPSYTFYALWPLSTNLGSQKHLWRSLIKALFDFMADEDLFYSSSKGHWLTLSQSQFLPSSLFQVPGVITNHSLLEAANILKLSIVSVPESYLQQLKFVYNKVNIVTQHDFLSDFLTNTNKFQNRINTRNTILFIALSVVGTAAGQSHPLKNLLIKFPCIPTSPEGFELKLACKLVDPHGFHYMFDPGDNMFPLDSFYHNALVHEAILQLGLMSSDNFTWDVIISSAKTVLPLYDKARKKALLRMGHILECISSKRECKDMPIEIKQIPFLPVLPKPKNYILPWKGGDHHLLPPCQVICPKFQSLKKTIFTVGSQKAIVNVNAVSKGGCGSISQNVLEQLSIPSKPSFEDVQEHFLCLIRSFNPVVHNYSEARDLVEKMCRNVYEHYESFLTGKELSLKQEATEQLANYHNKPFIFTGKVFVCPSNVSVNWKHPDGPYLYKLHGMLSECKSLLQCLQIKNDFSITKLLGTLHKMYNDFSPKHQLPTEYHKTVNDIVSELNAATSQELSNIKEEIYLPDKNYVLLPVNQLVYNDAPWLPTDEGSNYVTPLLSRDKALAFGVKPTSSKFLDKFTSEVQSFSGIEFGQKEELTQRIRNILHDYPFDISFFKELIQNADDAQAKKMVVILDKRQHGKRKVLSKRWGEELQGPALLVWNDKDFSDKDLDGIQRLGLGSKKDDDESIGQFGIGFNVVYHLTDCPSFITRGNTLCVFDPHCRYVLGSSPQCPGRKFNVDYKFWDSMSDLCFCFLQDKFPNKPPGLNKGALFRFPLRCTKEQVMHSEVIDKNFAKPVTSDLMELFMKEWLPAIKEALLFLSHIIQFEYYIINDNGMIALQESYCTHITKEDHQKKYNLRKSLSNFRATKEPLLITYLLKLETNVKTVKSRYQSTAENWLIQQGVGDVQNPSKNWIFLTKALPRHGIAAQLMRSDNFKGQVFCFLPLLIYTNLPVHINGQFILTSDRRSLWITSAKDPDEKVKWNCSLIEAIASSYAHFLGNAKPFFVANGGYDKNDDLMNAVNAYYSLFPFWNPPFRSQDHKSGTVSKQSISDWQGIGSMIFKLLWSINSSVLATEKVVNIKSTSTRTCTWFVDWHLLHDDNDSFKQAYFLHESDKSMKEILSNICIRITCAPHVLYAHLLLHGDNSIPPAIVNSDSVYHFYSNFHSQILTVKCPCDIKKTPFQSVEHFCTFIKYMLDKKHKFPDSPAFVPLMLTADNQLRVFQVSPDILLSRYCALFPASLYQFVHKSLVETYRKMPYFNTSNINSFSIISEVMHQNFPSKLQSHVVDNSQSSIIALGKLYNLWDCLCSDNVFIYHQDRIVKQWALIPSSTGMLYSASSPVRPIITDNDGRFQEIYQILLSFNIPIYTPRPNNQESDSDIRKYCIKLNQVDQVLKMLIHINNENNIFCDLKAQTVKVFLKYFRKMNVGQNPLCLKYIKSLPFFETIEGKLITVEKGEVFTCPEGLCKAGYHKWASQENLVFLNASGLWNHLGGAAVLNCEDIDPQNVYIRFIFPKFSILTSDERREHLEYIRHNQFIRNQSFQNHLCNLHCLETESNKLQRVSYFCDHTMPIFNTFSDQFSFVPHEYQTEHWLHFFRLLNLKTKVSIDGFKTCCKLVTQKNEPERSSVLVSYLFSQSAIEWHMSSKLLAEIGNIPFVQVDPLEDYQWIKMPHSTTGLTKLNESVLYNNAALVWTVKTVVHKSISIDATRYMESFQYEKNLKEASVFAEENETCLQMTLRKLGVTVEPSVDDVFKNLINISETQLSSFNLFTNYVTQDIWNKTRLENIIIRSLQFLFEKGAMSQLQELQCVPCIPVSAGKSSASMFINQPVLVKPIQVVRHISSDCKHLFPYLHQLPPCMLTVGHDLTKIGVLNNINLKSLQYLLETMHQQLISSIMSPNDAITVREAVIKINTLIETTHNTKADIISQLSPLYLPNADGYLTKSTDLVFIDTPHYQEAVLNFFGSPYSLFILSKESLQSMLKTGVKNSIEYKLSSNLPKKLRPFGLSLVCKEELLTCNASKNNVAHHVQHFENLKSIIPSLASVLSKVIAAHIKIIKEPDWEEAKINHFVSTVTNQFITGVNVIIVENLKCELKLLPTNNSLGIANVNILLQKSEHGSYSLYIDDKTVPGTYSFSKELAFVLCRETARLHEEKLTKYFNFSTPVYECLMAQSNNDLLHILEKFEVNASDIEILPANIAIDSVAIGRNIPDEMLPFLQVDINYIFHPEEWVGYEIREGYFVYAIVLHRILLDSNDLFERLYKIRIDFSDDGIRDVSTFELYSFVKKEQIEASNSTKILASSDENCTTAQLKNIDKLKKEILHELSMIQKIAVEDMCRKAKKRLYLHYLTDPINCNNEAIVFLKKELKMRSVGLISTDQPSKYTQLERDFNLWSTFAQKAHQKSSYEQSSLLWKLFDLQPQSDLFVAEMWLQQARTDLEAMKILKEQLSSKKVHCQVLFLAHETCEKSLKAGMYKLFGLNSDHLKSHDLFIHANAIASEERGKWAKLPQLVSHMEDYYLQTRFPNEHFPLSAPIDVYSSMDISNVTDDAEMVFDLVSLLFAKEGIMCK